MLWIWGELALAQRQPELALSLVDGLIASAPGEEQRAKGQPIPALLKLRGEALFALGSIDEALHALEEARRAAQEQEARPLVWQIHRSLTSVYTASGQKSLARRALTAAQEVIESLAASLDEPDARARFLRTAQATLPKHPLLTARQWAKHAFDGLSERECQIALLVAQGQSSREIAATLTISQRTVETHVGNIYAKLGVNSRAQIAAWTVAKGLATSLSTEDTLHQT